MQKGQRHVERILCGNMLLKDLKCFFLEGGQLTTVKRKATEFGIWMEEN